MAGTAIKMITGVLDGKSIRNSITQTSHGFSAGFVVRWDVEQQGFTAAKATSPEEAEVSGIVESRTDDNTFVLVYQGEIKLADMVTTGRGDTADEVYFLSTVTAGYMDHNPPSSAGHVIKPILTRRGTPSGTSVQKGLVMNYLGTIIGGEATVSLDGLMPVGVIQPYAGISSGIPSGWSVCDGGTLDIHHYQEYYSRVSWKYGVIQKLTVPNLTDGPNVGDTVNQVLATGRGPSGVVLDWNSATKEIVVDVNINNVNGQFTHDDELYKVFIPSDTADTGFGDLTVGTDDYNVSTVTDTYVKKPDLRSRVPIGAGDDTRIAGVVSQYFRGEFGGEQTHVLSTDELPEHDHNATQTVSSLELPAHSHDITFNDVTTGNPPDDWNIRLRAGDNPDSSNSGDDWAFVFRSDSNSQGDNKSFASGDHSFHTHVNLGNSYFYGTDHTHTISSTDLPSATNNTGPITIDLPEAGLVTIDPVGLGLAHNNMQPFLVTNYIVRISSEARAALLDNLDINLSLEGLNNVNDGSPGGQEMVRYNSGNSEYEKIQPNIDGLGSKDNKDVVIHASQGTDGSTLEVVRFTTDNRVFIGSTQGATASSGNIGQSTVMVARNSCPGGTMNSLILLQGATHEGASGAYFGVDQNHTILWNYGMGAYAGFNATGGNSDRSRGFEFKVGGLAGESNRLLAKINDTHFIVGTKTFSQEGCSLDVDGGIGAYGDIYTYATSGATHGVFGNILGVTNEVGGYNLPVTAGVSGEVLMVCATGGGLGYTLEFKAVASPTVLFSGHAATGASFGGTVGIGTGGNGAGTSPGHFGALLEVGGPARFHGGITAENIYVGGSQSHTTTQYLFSGKTAGNARFALRSSGSHSQVYLDCASGNQSAIFFRQGAPKAAIYYNDSDTSTRYTDYFNAGGGAAHNSYMKSNGSGKVCLGLNGSPATNFAVTVATGGNGKAFTVQGKSLFSYNGTHGTADVSGHSSTFQIFDRNNAFIQIGTTSGKNGVANSFGNFGATNGFFLGVTSDSVAQIKHIGEHGGTIGFGVGTSMGNTCAMLIHNSGTVQIGATSGGEGGYIGVKGYKSQGYGGLAVVDYTGSTGNSGDVLVNADNTGQVKWASTNQTAVMGIAQFQVTIEHNRVSAFVTKDGFGSQKRMLGAVSAITLENAGVAGDSRVVITHNNGDVNYIAQIAAVSCDDSANHVIDLNNNGLTYNANEFKFNPTKRGGDSIDVSITVTFYKNTDGSAVSTS